MSKIYLLSDPIQYKVLAKTSSNSLEEAIQTFISNAYKVKLYDTDEDLLVSFIEDPNSISDKKLRELYISKFVWKEEEENFQLLPGDNNYLLKQLYSLRLKECLLGDYYAYDSCTVICIDDLMEV
jgi:hypothetical protein